MKKTLIQLSILLLPAILFSQVKKTDSLITAFELTENDSIKTEISKQIFWNWMEIDVDSALIYAKKYYIYFSTKKEERGIMYNAQAISYCYIKKGNYNLALSYSLAALKKINKPEYRFILLMNLAETNRTLENFSDAKEELFEAITIIKTLDNDISLIGAFNRLAAVLYKLSEFDEAIKYADSSIVLATKYGDSLKIANNYEIKGSIYNFKNDYSKAIGFYKMALNINTHLKDSTSIQNNYSNIGISYYLAKQYQLSIKYLQKSVELCHRFDLFMNLLNSYIFLGHSYNGIKNYEKAYFYTDSALDLRIRLFDEQRDMQIQTLIKNYKLEEKNQQLVSNEIEIKNKRKLNTAYLIIIAIISILLLYIIISRNKLKKQKQTLNDLNNNLYINNRKIKIQFKKLNQLNKKLKNLVKFKEISTQMIVHDLKNPLNRIISTTNKNVESAQYMLLLVENILNYSKIENTNFTIKFEPVNLISVIKKAYEETKFLSENKSIVIKINLNKNIIINGEYDILKRVFVNLFTNSIKYTKSGGEIIVSSQIIDKYISIKVHDNGIGIKQEKINKVFEIYEHDTQRNEDNVSTTGIGLFFVKKAILAHEGKIHIESEVNVGTSIIFTLKLLSYNNEKINLIKTDNQNIILTNKEKEELQNFIEKLEQTEIYEISKIKKILIEINTESENIKEWKEKLLFSINNYNKDLFFRLLKIAKH